MELNVGRKGVVQTNAENAATEFLSTLNMTYWPPIDNYSVLLALSTLGTECAIFS
jgi:hypothetical protein